MTLVLFLGCLLSHNVMTRPKNISPEKSGEKFLISFSSSGVVQTQEIQAIPKSHFVCRLAGGFRSPLLEFTCASSDSVQHYPLYFPNLFIILLSLINSNKMLNKTVEYSHYFNTSIILPNNIG